MAKKAHPVQMKKKEDPTFVGIIDLRMALVKVRRDFRRTAPRFRKKTEYNRKEKHPNKEVE